MEGGRSGPSSTRRRGRTGGIRAAQRRSGILLQRRHDCGSGRQDLQPLSDSADVRGRPGRDGDQVQHLRGHRRRPRVQEAVPRGTRSRRRPFYAAWSTPIIHDSVTGLRTNTNAQVMDMQDQVIPGLYAAGESQGGFAQHGLGRTASSAASPAGMRPGTAESLGPIWEKRALGRGGFLTSWPHIKRRYRKMSPSRCLLDTRGRRRHHPEGQGSVSRGVVTCAAWPVSVRRSEETYRHQRTRHVLMRR